MSALETFSRNLNKLWMESGGKGSSWAGDLSRAVGVTPRMIHQYATEGVEPKLGIAIEISKFLTGDETALFTERDPAARVIHQNEELYDLRLRVIQRVLLARKSPLGAVLEILEASQGEDLSSSRSKL